MQNDQWSSCWPFLVSSSFLHPTRNFNTRKVCKTWQKEPLFAEYREALIKYYLCQCSSLIAVLTNGPLSLRDPPSIQPVIGLWISEKRMEERQQFFQTFTGQTAAAKMTDRMSLSPHSVVSFLLHSCLSFRPSFVPSLHLPSLIQLVPPFDAVWRQLPLGEARLIPLDSWDTEDSRSSQNQQTWSEQVLRCASDLSLSPSILHSLLWLLF